MEKALTSKGPYSSFLPAWGAAAVAASIAAIFLVAPIERTMGAAQRIVYVHVPCAWLGLAGFLIAAAAGGMYLRRRDLAWDAWAQAAAELGWVFCSLTLLTGSLWAHAAWNVWWTWDPRLTTAAVLWALYSGCSLVRAGVDDPHRRARLGAVVAILGAIDVPLVFMASRWFRGIHPAAPAMEPRMRVVLLLNVFAFTVFFALVLVWRRNRLLHARGLETLAAEDDA